MRQKDEANGMKKRARSVIRSNKGGWKAFLNACLYAEDWGRTIDSCIPPQTPQTMVD